MIRRLFIDIETTGLPLTKGFGKWFPYSSLHHYNSSRVISIAWLHQRGDKIGEFREMFIKPDKFKIRNTEFHGIKHSYAMKHGEDIRKMFEDFQHTLENSDELLSYNIGFDFNVLCSELHRYGYHSLLETMEKIKKRCVMQECFDKGHKNGKKYMKLVDLHKKLFKEDFKAHSAYEDTYAAYRVFNEVIGDKEK